MNLGRCFRLVFSILASFKIPSLSLGDSLILTSNNQTAKISVAEEVPYATGESLATGQSQTTTDYREIGIILEVTPSINPDGLVNMTILPEISSQTGESVQISENLTLPVFSTVA